MSSKRYQRRRSCDNKKRYGTRADARSAVRALAIQGQRWVMEWRCGHCGFWHVGHAPRWIRERIRERLELA